MYQFRDPVHGFIDVSEDELKIIDSAPFQRLRNIRQLATTYLVYHGAEHTRYGHSLGVMHLTSRVFKSVVSKRPNLFSANDEENDIKVRWYLQILRLIGLTHDLGRAPFSRASEDVFVDNLDHEHYTKKIIFETEIAGYIHEIGRKFQAEYGEAYEITPEILWMIYSGEDVTSAKFITPDFFFLRSFMDGELDCDKMDYLLRDSLYCGVSYGKFDLDRFISTLTVYKTEGRMQLAIERGGIQSLEEFVLARYFMFIQVYYHKTRRYLDHLLVDCLESILPGGKYPKDTLEYLSWDDNLVLALIANSDSPAAVLFRKRQIMTCVYESKAHAEKSDAKYVSLLLSQLRTLYGDKILHDKVDKAAHKLTPSILLANDDSGKGIPILDEKTGEISSIMDESIILNSLIQPIDIERIYATKDIAADVQKDIRAMQTN